MKSVKKPVKFKSLSLPEPLFNEMKDHVQKSSEYRNMAEFLRASIREKMERDKTPFVSEEMKKYIDNRFTEMLKETMDSKTFKEYQKWKK